MTFLDDFLRETKAIRSAETYKTYAKILRYFDAWLRRNKKSLEMCTYNDIYAYLDANKKWKNQTKSQTIGRIKMFFRYYNARIPMGVTTQELRAAYLEKQRVDQVLNMRMPTYLKKQEEQKKKFLMVGELQKLLDACDETDYVIVYLLAYFGLRKSELLGIKAKDMDYNGIYGILRITTAKTYKPRRLYFNGYAGSLLKRYMDMGMKNGYDFNNRLQAYSKAMGFRVFPHQMRHTFNMNQRRILKNDMLLKVLMGHSTSADMTNLYDDALDSEMRDAMLKNHYMNKIRKKEI